MLRFLFCLLYLAVLGLLCFPFGRLLARRTYDPARWPFRQRRFEMDGKFYESIKIKTWENQVPDVSRWAPEIVPVKRVTGRMTAEMCAGMINETCGASLDLAGLGRRGGISGGRAAGERAVYPDPALSAAAAAARAGTAAPAGNGKNERKERGK